MVLDPKRRKELEEKINTNSNKDNEALKNSIAVADLKDLDFDDKEYLLGKIDTKLSENKKARDAAKVEWTDLDDFGESA